MLLDQCYPLKRDSPQRECPSTRELHILGIKSNEQLREQEHLKPKRECNLEGGLWEMGKKMGGRTYQRRRQHLRDEHAQLRYIIVPTLACPDLLMNMWGIRR